MEGKVLLLQKNKTASKSDVRESELASMHKDMNSIFHL